MRSLESYWEQVVWLAMTLLGSASRLALSFWISNAR